MSGSNIQDRDRVILITGASGGIGLELSEELIRRGFKKIAFVYNSRSDELKKLLEKFSIDEKNHLYQCDLTDETQLNDLKNNIHQRLGNVWGIINLAGASKNAMSWKITKDDFNSIIENNLTTAFLCSKTFIPQMRNQNGGRIIFVSSIAGRQGIIGAAHYCAAKAGIEGLTVGLSKELASKKVTVNCISLGYFDKGLISHVPEEMQKDILNKISLNRFSSPHELTGLVSLLLSDESSYMTGSVINFNGGLI